MGWQIKGAGEYHIRTATLQVQQRIMVWYLLMG